MLKKPEFYKNHRLVLQMVWQKYQKNIPWDIKLQVDHRVERHDLDKFRWSGLGIGSNTRHELENDHHLAYYRVNNLDVICDAAVIEMLLDWQAGFLGKGYQLNARAAFEYKYKERMNANWHKQFYHWLDVMEL